MRTTLILRDDLIEIAKKQAAERKTTLSAIVEEALRIALSAQTSKPELSEPSLPTYAPPGYQKTDMSPGEIADLMVAEDLESYGGSEAT